MHALGRIVNGEFVGEIDLSRFEGKEVSLEVKLLRNIRSSKQNRYFHGVILPILCEHCGYFPDEMKAALAHKFLGHVDPDTGLTRIRSTAELNTVEFEEFLARIRQWAGEEMGVGIPLPNEPLEAL